MHTWKEYLEFLKEARDSLPPYVKRANDPQMVHCHDAQAIVWYAWETRDSDKQLHMRESKQDKGRGNRMLRDLASAVRTDLLPEVNAEAKLEQKERERVFKRYETKLKALFASVRSVGSLGLDLEETHSRIFSLHDQLAQRKKLLKAGSIHESADGLRDDIDELAQMQRAIAIQREKSPPQAILPTLATHGTEKRLLDNLVDWCKGKINKINIIKKKLHPDKNPPADAQLATLYFTFMWARQAWGPARRQSLLNRLGVAGLRQVVRNGAPEPLPNTQQLLR